jgi:hypothetical protein
MFCVGIVGVALALGAAAEPLKSPPRHEPLKVVVLGEWFLTCEPLGYGDWSASAAPLDHPERCRDAGRWGGDYLDMLYLGRWHVSSDYLWRSTSGAPIEGGLGLIVRYPVTWGWVGGEGVVAWPRSALLPPTGPKELPWRESERLPAVPATPLDYIRDAGAMLGGKALGWDARHLYAEKKVRTEDDLRPYREAADPGRPQVYYDYLPTSGREVRLLVLTNVPPGLDTKSAKERERLPGKEELKKILKWSFTVYRYRPRPAEKDKRGSTPGTPSAEERRRPAFSHPFLTNPRWTPGSWSKEGTIAAAFKEGFQALGLGGDYYFVTDSGKLYRAPRPAEGTHRALLKVWSDAKRPIAGLVQDVDAGRTFLFCKAASPKDKPVYFEMAPTVKPQPCDLQAVKVPEYDKETREFLEMTRWLDAVRYARWLHEHKLLGKKDKGKPEPGSSP